MYHGNQEYYALKRRLIDDTKKNLNKKPIVSSAPSATSIANINYTDVKQNINTCEYNVFINGLVYVYEWCDDDNDIFGYGCNMRGESCLLKVHIKPRLFVASPNVLLLQHIVNVYGGYTIKTYDIQYDGNNFAAFDLMWNHDLSHSKCWLVAIEADTVTKINQLYYTFRNNENAYKYALVTHYYDSTKQIMFELLIRNVARQKQINNTIKNDDIDYTIPQTFDLWFDCKLNVYEKMPKHKIPIITFDIETVSDDPHRVPTGDDPYDILYSVSIHHVHTNILYSLIYLPLFEKDVKTITDYVTSDGYDVVPEKSVNYSNASNIVECFNNERHLLKRTMELLTIEPKLHMLIGYNSLGYDMKYLLMRCVFFNISTNRFIWREGYCFGNSQFHIDLFRIILMRYRYKSYTLNDVSGELLKESKTGVSAVALRYSFFRMYKHQRYFTHDECSEKMPSVRDTLHYNNADTLLVSKLENRTQAIEFLLNYAQRCQVPMSTLMTSYNKMQYKLWNECLIIGLNMKLFMGQFKSSIAPIICPFRSAVNYNDFIELRIDLTDNLNGSEQIESAPLPEMPGKTPISAAATAAAASNRRYITIKKKAKFPGGANFCLGEYNCDSVQMYDYVTAYPLLMDRKNISDETTTILPANVLVEMYPYIMNPHEYQCFDYLTHHGRTHSETIILYYQYIYNNLYCGGQFEFTLEELKKRVSAPVIVIWSGRRGIISAIIAKFNDIRATTKIKRNILKAALETVSNKLEIANNEAFMEAEMEVYAAAASTTETSENDITNNSNNLTFDSIYGNDDTDAFDMLFDDENSSSSNSNNNDSTTMMDVSITNHKPHNENGDSNCDINDNGNDGEDNDDNDDDDAFGDYCFGDDDDDDKIDNVAAAVAVVDDSPLEMPLSQNDKSKQNSDTIISNNNKIIYNPYNFKFVNRYVYVDTKKSCIIDDDELDKSMDKIKILRDIQNEIDYEYKATSNTYDLLKSTVASIYGCIGQMIPVVAASITCITRTTLLQSARFCKSLGNEILYIDTDSIMMPTKCADLSAKLNEMYPYMEMEMKTTPTAMFVKRKTYYKWEDGKLKYGQNVNGPSAWRDFVIFVYNYTQIHTNDDIHKMFYDFFMKTYEKLHGYSKVTPEFLKHFTHTIKLKSEYKTATVAYKFQQYLAIKYPEIAGAHKHTIYYHFDSTSVLIPQLRPEIEIKTIQDLQYVNLFKFYQNMFTTIFNLVKFRIKTNNQPYNITISSKYVQLQMLSAFLDAYKQTFAHLMLDMPMIKATDEENYIDNPEINEILFDDHHEKNKNE